MSSPVGTPPTPQRHTQSRNNSSSNDTLVATPGTPSETPNPQTQPQTQSQQSFTQGGKPKSPSTHVETTLQADIGANGDSKSLPLARFLSNQSNTLNVPPYRPPHRSQSPDTISLISADDFSELRLTRSESWAQPPHVAAAQEADSRPDGTGLKTKGIKARMAVSWKRNKGLFFVLLAQFFGMTMNITTRMLEGDGSEGNHGMHPFQILFARMSITCVLASVYMWYTQTPDFPFGARGVRLLLVLRGLGGFWGVYGLYWSLQYLALADATVITYLSPMISCWVCSKILHQLFTRAEQIAALVSLVGVVLVAQPTYLFSHSSSTSSSPEADNAPSDTDISRLVFARAGTAPPPATPEQRLAAVGMALVGVMGATIAYTTIRWIGHRAHPLISVNYFAAWCTIVSAVALLFFPSIGFVLPSSARDWTLLLFIGVSGFVMQFLLTAGLGYEKNSRATNMAYSSMLFAVAGDKVVFGISPSAWSIAGSSLIIGSAIVVAMQKDSPTKTPVASKGEGAAAADVEGGLEMGQRSQSGDRDSASGRRGRPINNNNQNDDEQEEEEQLGLVANAEPTTLEEEERTRISH